jgi:hypothetical protein
MTGFASRASNYPGRISWWTDAESLNDRPLQMQYRDLDRRAQYRIRVIYGGDAAPVPIRLVANDKWEVYPATQKDTDFKPLVFDFPKEATASGELRLTWSKPAGLGGAGRGVQLAEVWLMRK